MTTQTEKAARFLELHRPGNPLLLPNPWDQGSAKLLASLGFQALATTSSGFAVTLGRSDGSVSRDEALAHAAAIVSATDLPVSADLENGFADDPDGVAHTVSLAVETGLAGLSVEDFSGRDAEPIYDIGLAAERVAAAAEAAHAGSPRLVLTARAENYLHGRPDLADTIARLQAYQAAGADVLYAPGLTSLADIRQVVSAVDRPVNVLAMPGVPPVSELAAAGVSRVSVGGALAFAALSSIADAAIELRDQGTYGLSNGQRGRTAGRAERRRAGRLMREDVRQALAITRSSTIEDRTVDITTTGRRSGEPRRIEIVFYRSGDSVYLSGVPAPRTRDWLANLAANPRFTFHLKHGVVADLPAVAEVITDPAERRRLLAGFVDEFNDRNGPDSPWGKAVLDEWVEASPLARVSFPDGD